MVLVSPSCIELELVLRVTERLQCYDPVPDKPHGYARARKL